MTVSAHAEPDILVYLDAEAVAEALTRQLVERLTELQSDGRVPQLCLTGGRIATQAYQRLAAAGAQSAAGSPSVDWSRVGLWWGDERFVPADSPDRNAEPVLATLGSLGLDPDLVHTMPARDAGLGLDEAAAAYEEQLGDTVFDVCLLGMGPDGHVASLFPGHETESDAGHVIGVRDSPKPPPERISLTLRVINRSREVWLVVAGEDKAQAAATALLATDTVPVPAAGAEGGVRTVWLLDRAAASKLPPEMVDPETL